MTVKNVLVQSDVFHQVKPSSLQDLYALVQGGSKHGHCAFLRSRTPDWDGRDDGKVWAAHRLNFTNEQVYNLLKKSIDLVQDSEEYFSYQLKKAFPETGTEKRAYSTPPGTVRFYDQDLICYYSGKVWKKLVP